jgi:GNAT superfamily N-acetyltransferase
MTVRERRPEDLAECVRALAEVHARDGYPTWWPADPAGWLSPAGILAAWVAEVGGTVVGHVCVVTGGDEDAAGVTVGEPAMVSRLFVAPAGRGRGLGAALLAEARQFAATGNRTLMLDVVDDGGAAVALYERLGWRLVERRSAEWTTPQGERPWLRVYLAPAGEVGRVAGGAVVQNPLEQLGVAPAAVDVQVVGGRAVLDEPVLGQHPL